MRLALLLALLSPVAALAQYAGPGVEACRTYAEQQHKADGGMPASFVFDKDRHLGIDRYTKKLGTQSVSSILYGNGAIVAPTGPAAEMSFVCLLADDRRPVFFHWIARGDASSLAQCTRNATQKSKAASCLDALQVVTDQDLTQAFAVVFQQARDVDAKAGNENASNALRRSNQAWLAYRDAECSRRPAGDARAACVLDLSRRRLLDARN